MVCGLRHPRCFFIYTGKRRQRRREAL